MVERGGITVKAVFFEDVNRLEFDVIVVLGFGEEGGSDVGFGVLGVRIVGV